MEAILAILTVLAILIIPFVVIYKSKRRLLVSAWLIISYAWAFLGFARAIYVEEEFIYTPLWLAITFPMYSAFWVIGWMVSWLPHDLSLKVDEFLILPVDFLLSVFYLWLAYKIIKLSALRLNRKGTHSRVKHSKE